MTNSLFLAVVIGSVFLPSLSGLLGKALRRRPAVADLVCRFTMVSLLVLPILVVSTPRIFRVQKLRTGTTSERPAGDVVNPVSKNGAIVPSRPDRTDRIPDENHEATTDLPPDRVAENRVDENHMAAETTIPEPVRAADASIGPNRFEDESVRSFPPIVFPLWGAGAVFCLLILYRNYRTCFIVRKTASPVFDPDWKSLCDELIIRCGVRRKLRLLRSPDVSVPQVIGLFRPAILLPDELLETPPNAGLLVHELAHIKRRDVFWQIFSACVTTLYWFQPLVWLHVAAMRRLREEICDAHVLLEGVRGSDYAATLLDMASRIQRGRPMPAANACAVALPQSELHLERRILSLFDAGTDRTSISPLALLLTFIPLSCIAFLFVLFCPGLGRDGDTPMKNDVRQLELFGCGIRWKASEKTKPTSPVRLAGRDFGHYFPKEQLYLENFDDWHAQCRSDELLGLSSEKLNALRCDSKGKSVPNETLLKIAHAQITGGYLVDAAKTLDSVVPRRHDGDSLDVNMAQRHDVRRGDALRSEYYLKDRALRFLARMQSGSHPEAATESALKIFSVPERNDALLEIMRSECQNALDAKGEKDLRKHLDQAVEIHAKIVDPSRDHGFGILAVAYGKTGNRARSTEMVRRIVDPDVRELALGWSVSGIVPTKDPVDSAQGELALLKLRWRETERFNVDETKKDRIRNEIRLAVQGLPASGEKFVYLREIGTVFAYRDHAATREILMSIFDDIRNADAADPLLVDGAVKILDSNRRYKDRSTASWRSDKEAAKAGFHGLNNEDIENIGQLLVDRGPTRFAVFSRTRPASPGDEKDPVVQTLKREPGMILRSILPHDDLPGVAGMIFSLDLRQDVLESIYADVYRCFRNPRSKGFEDAFFVRAGAETKKYYLAALLPAFLDAPDFPWRDYLNEIERTPDAENRLRDRIEYGLRGRYDPHTPESIFRERFAALKSILGITVANNED